MRLLAVFGLVVASSLSACTVDNRGPAPGSNGSSGGSASTDGSASPDGGSSQSNAPQSNDGPSDTPAPSQTAAEIDVDGTCSAWVACGGNPQGTFDYTGGCIEDVFAGARGACPALDTTKATVNVKGSVTFKGNALAREVTLTVGGALTFPQSCTFGQCATLESELKGAFDSVTCTGSSDCTCTVSKIENEKDATTYTIQGSLVTTADGDEYSICEQGSALSYSGKSAGSEQGTFTLKKR